MADELDTSGAVDAFLAQPAPAQAARQSVALSIQTKPDEEAEFRRLSTAAGLPLDTVRSQPDAVRNQVKLDSMNFDGMASTSPATTKFLGNPDNAAIAHDEPGALTAIEKGMRGFLDGGSLKRTGAANYLGASLKSGVLNLLGAGAKIADTLNPFTTSDADLAVLFKNDSQGLADATGSLPNALSTAARAMSSSANATMENISPEAKKNYGDLKYATTDVSKAAYLSPVKIIGDVMNSLPTSAALALSVYLTRSSASAASAEALAAGATAEVAHAAGIAAARSTMANVGAISEGSVGFAQQSNSVMNDLMEKGKEGMAKSPRYAALIAEGYTPEAALQSVAAETAQQAGIFAGSIDAITNKVLGGFLGKILAEGGSVVSRSAKGFGNEALTETIQSAGEQFGQNVAQRSLVDPKLALDTDVLEQAVQGLVVGGVSGGMFAGLAGAGRTAEQAQVADANAAKLKELFDMAAATNLHKRDPNTLAGFVQSVADQDAGTPSALYVDAATLAETLQQAGISVEQFGQAVPAVAEQFADAIKTGDSIELPIGQLTAQVAGTPLEPVLLQHLRTSPDALSQAEAKEATAQAQKEMAKEADSAIEQNAEAEAMRASSDAVKGFVAEQLATANRFTNDVNQAYASLVGDFYTVTASRLGMTPEALYQRYPLKIEASSTAKRVEAFDQAGNLKTETPEFKNWFGDSKVVDADGKPLVVYHGSTRGGISSNTVQTSFFTSDSDVARTYSEDDYAGAKGEKPVVQQVYLKMDNPLVVNANGDEWMRIEFEGNRYTTDELARKAKSMGHDGLIIENVIDNVSDEELPPATIYATLGGRSQIKSATGNNGDFDPANPNILKQDENRPGKDIGALNENFNQDAAGIYQTSAGELPVGGRVPGSARGVDVAPGQDTGTDQPLTGLPATVKVDGRDVTFGPFAPARQAARAYAESAGIKYKPATTYEKVDPERAKRIADAFEAMEHNPNDPAVKRAYEALAKETLAQWEAIKATGLVVEFMMGGDSYGNPRNAILDVVNNNHLWVYPTDAGFGGTESANVDISGNPLLAVVPGETISGQQVRVNDIFRIVHDYFGHIAEGVGFRADGEENAYRQHYAMFSPEARKALATETRGQNSWVNFGPYAEFNKTASGADTQYAPQKIGLLPDWAINGGATDAVTLPGQAVHFSRNARTALDGRYYGTGLKGLEDERLQDATDPRLKERVYFYLDTGNGVRPEAGVGGIAHSVELPKMYDAQANPEGLWKGGTPEAISETESRLLDAGYGGYFVRSIGNGQGAGVVIGPASRGLKAEQIPNPVTDYQAPETVQPYKRGLLSKEAHALDIEAIQAVAPSAKLRGGIFQVNQDEFDAAKKIAAQQGVELPEAKFDQTMTQSARGSFNPSQLKVTLLQNADLSTFLHESGHFFLEVMGDIANQPDAPADIQKDMKAVLDWFGIKDDKQALPAGVTLELRPSTKGDGQEIIARDEKGNEIGGLVFDTATDDAGNRINPSVSVDPKWRRKGIASAMYALAEQNGGLIPAVDQPGQARSAEGTAFRNGLAAKQQGQTAIQKWLSMSVDEQREHHEKFARAFEAYLFEGKAPNLSLQSLFQRFRDWMVNVYRNISQLDVTLTDEVRQVFDRLLATDQQIAEAQQSRAYAPMFKDAAEAGMTPEEWAAYQNQGARATADATDILQSRSLKDMQWLTNARSRVMKRLQQDAKTKRAAVEQEVAAEVAQEQVYAAQRWMKGKGLPDGTPAAGAKMSMAGLREMFGDGPAALWRYLPTNLVSTDPLQSMHPDDIASMFEYPSGDAMVRDITQSDKEAVAIEGKTDQRMLERYGDVATPEAMARAADEAVHNEARTRFVATELIALRKATNVREKTAAGGTINVMLRAAREYAANVISRKQIGKLRPDLHEAAEARAAKQAEDAMRKGDLVEAATAKRNQLLNNAVTKEAYAALDDVQKTRDFFRRVLAGKDDVVSKTRDMDVVNAARAVIAQYGIGATRGQSALDYMELVAKNDPLTYSVLKLPVEQAIMNAKPFKELTVEEMRGLRDEIESMWHLAKRTREMVVGGQVIDMQEAADALKGRMQDIGVPAVMPGDLSAPTSAEKRLAMMRTVKAAAVRVEAWAGAKDGGVPIGPFRKYIFQVVKEAADAYRGDKAKYLKQYRELLGTMEDVFVRELIPAPELGYTFGKSRGGVGMSELMHAILHTGNYSNKRKLLLGRGWATLNANGSLDTTKWDAFIQRMHDTGKLNKASYDFAQGVWDLLESTKPLAQKAHRDVFGKYFAEITADTFSTPFGDYKGGYVPAMADPEIVQDAAIRGLVEAENENMAFAFPATNKGFTKSRVEYNRPLKLDLRSIGQHLDKVLLFSHMEQPVRDVRKLLMDKGVSYTLGRVDPAAIPALLTPWLNRSARQQVETPIIGDGGAARWFSVMRNNAGMAAMIANVANTAQQLAGFSLASVKVPPKYLAGGIVEYLRSPSEASAAVSAASQYMATRMDNEVAAMNGYIDDILLDEGLYAKTQKWLQRHAYFMQSAVDNIMGPAIWIGARNQALEQGLSEADAVRVADSAIRETQGSTLPEDVSRIETGNSFVRLFTQFMGYFNMQANLLGGEFAKIQHAGGLRKGAGRALYVTTFGFLVNAWVAEAIMQAFKGGPDDDEDKDGSYLDDWVKQVFGWALVRNATAMVPVAGPLAMGVVNATNSKSYDDRLATSPAISMLETAVRAPVSVYKAMVDDGKKVKAVRDVATMISLMTGIPVTGIARPLAYLVGVSANEIVPTSALDTARGVVTGTPSPESKNR